MTTSYPSKAVRVLAPNQQAHALLVRLIERVGLTKRSFLDRLADIGYAFSDDDFANWGRAGRAFPRDWAALQAMVHVLIQDQPASRRCSAAEALSFLGLIGMPFSELHALGAIFSADELNVALQSYVPDTGLRLAFQPAEDGQRSGPAQATAHGSSANETAASPSLKTGLEALQTLMAATDVRDAVFTFHSDFRAACEHIKLLGHYKQLHDLLQRLEGLFYLLFHDHARLTADPATWLTIERHEPELVGLIDDVIAAAQRISGATDTPLWTSKLVQARQHLRQGIEQRDTGLLRAAVTRLKDVLGREPSRINTRLVNTAQLLRLAALVTALLTIRNRLATLRRPKDAADKLVLFSQTVNELGLLHDRLDAAIMQHNLFQAIDDELRRVEALVAQDLSEVVYACQNLKPMTQSVYETSEYQWAGELHATGLELEQLLPTQNTARIIRLFRSYRSQAIRAFNQGDQGLLMLCEQLREVGEPLAMVLRMIA